MVLVLLNYNYPNDELLLINKHKSSKNDIVIHETTNTWFTASGFQFIRPEFIKHAYETRPLCCPHSSSDAHLTEIQREITTTILPQTGC